MADVNITGSAKSVREAFAEAIKASGRFRDELVKDAAEVSREHRNVAGELKYIEKYIKVAFEQGGYAAVKLNSNLRGVQVQLRGIDLEARKTKAAIDALAKGAAKGLVGSSGITKEQRQFAESADRVKRQTELNNLKQDIKTRLTAQTELEKQRVAQARLTNKQINEDEQASRQSTLNRLKNDIRERLSIQTELEKQRIKQAEITNKKIIKDEEIARKTELERLKKDIIERAKIEKERPGTIFAERKAITSSTATRLNATAAEVGRYQSALQSVQQIVKKHGFSLDQVQGMWRDIATGNVKTYSGQLGDLQRRLLTLATAQKKLGAEARAAAARRIKDNDKVLDSQQRLIQSAKGLLLSWQSIVRLFSIQLIHVAISQMIANIRAGVKYSIDLQKSLAEIQTITQRVDGTTESTAKWLKVAVEQSNKFGIDVAEELESAYQAVSNQIVKTAEDFQYFGESIDRFALATKSTADDSVNLLSAALNSFQLSLSQADQVAASFFKTIELGRVRANEMSDSYGQISIMAHQLGIDMNELNSLIAVATIRGIKYDETATQIRGILTKLLKPTEEMSKLYAEIGVSSGEAAIEAYGLSGFLQLLARHTAGSSTETAKMINRMRGLSLAMLLTNEGMDQYNKVLGELRNSQEDYARATDLVVNNIGKKLEKEFSKVKNFFQVELAGNVTKTIVSFAEHIGGLDRAFREVSNVMKSAFIGALAASGLAILKLAGSWELLVATMSAHPFLWIAAGVTALIYLFDKLTVSQKEYKKVLEDIAETEKANYRERVKRERDAVASQLEKNEIQIKTMIQNGNQELAIATSIIARRIQEYREGEKDFLKIMEDVNERINTLVDERTDKFKDSVKEISSEIEKLQDSIRKRPGDVEATIFDWLLENKKPKQQIEEIKKRIRDLKKELFSSTDTERIKDLSQEIQNLFERQINLTTRGKKNRRSGVDQRTIQEYRDFQNKLQQHEIALLNRRNNEEARGNLILKQRARFQEQIKKIQEDIKEFASRKEDIIDTKKIRDAEAELQKLKGDILLTDDPTRQQEIWKQIQVAEENFRRAQEESITQSTQAQINRLQTLANALDSESQAKAREDWNSIKTNDPNLRAQIQQEIINQRKQDEEYIANLRKQADDAALLAEHQIANSRIESVRRSREYQIETWRRSMSMLEGQLEEVRKLQDTIKTTAPDLVASIALVTDRMNKISESKILKLYTDKQREALTQSELTGKNQTDFITALERSFTQSFKTPEQVVQQFGPLLSNLDKFTETGQANLQDAMTLIKQITELESKFADSGLTQGAIDIQNQFKDLKKALQDAIDKNLDPSGLGQVIKSMEETQIKVSDEFKRIVDSFGEPMDILIERIGSLSTTMKDVGEQISKAITDTRNLTTRTIPGTNIPAGNHNGGPIGFARGGFVHYEDTIPAWLSPGEFVMNRRSTNRFRSQLFSMNYGLLPQREESNSGTAFQFGDINIDARGIQNIDQFADQIHGAIQRRMNQGLLKK